jgi:predicted acylesterase/phospholipase RssA/CRP-like cAMP-binding protein
MNLGETAIFAGLDADALAQIALQLRVRHLQPNELLFMQGEHGTSLFVIQHGLLQVFLQHAEGTTPLARLRHGDVIGEVALVFGGARTASAMAIIPSAVLELTQEAFTALYERYPQVLSNLVRILSQRLARTNSRADEHRRRGETIALVLCPPKRSIAEALIAATRNACPHAVAALDLTGVLAADPSVHQHADVEAALAAVDEIHFEHATILVLTSPNQIGLSSLLDTMERVFWVGDPAAITSAAAQRAVDRTAAAIPFTASPMRAPTLAGLPVPRVVRHGHPADLEWLGRHLARTKLGLALGAGGAKAYAHLGVMQVLEDARVAVDYLAGASAGALVGALLAMGLGAAGAETSMRRHMTAANCTILMKGMLGGAEPVNLMTRLLREMTQDCTFADLETPLVVLTVNADTRRPYPISSGPVWEAVLASWSLPGAFPPYIRDGQRLVDGVVMTPVPTSYVMQAGADVTVGIDVLSSALPAWPGEDPPDPNVPRHTMNWIEALVDTMELGYADASARHAALSDVPMTPQFGPSKYRDFQLADRFVAAGREEARAKLPVLERLVRPLVPSRRLSAERKGNYDDYGAAAVHVHGLE